MSPDNPRSPVARGVPLLLAALPIAVLPPAVSGQSAADIMAEARAAYESRVEGIQDYTVVQRVMGTRSTLHFERAEVDGMVFFRPRQMAVAAGGESAEQRFNDALFLRDDVAERMTYEGTDEVSGHACHILALDDFEGLDLEGAVPAEAEGVDVESVRMCMDTERHVALRMEMKGTATLEGEPRPFESVIVMSDYRDVEGGLLHPFRMEMTMSGIAASSEQQAEMAEALARMEKQLEQLPESQRERMRAMMESRMGLMEGAMGVARGEPLVIETVEVRVNQGPPGGRP